MTQPPEFRLHRLKHADCDGIMKIIPVSRVELDTTMPRRSMFRAGLTVASAFAAFTACNNTRPTAPEATTSPPLNTSPPSVGPLPPITTTTEPTPTTTTAEPTETSSETQVAPVPPLTRNPGPGRRESGTLPCGSALPPGAICTCNCVPAPY